MTVDKLLTDLSRREIILSVDGNRLLFDAPAGALTPELRAAITARRAELIARLSVVATSPAPPATVSARPLIDFSRWVCRPTADGTIGWEAPDIPPSIRWWARKAWPPARQPDEHEPAVSRA